MIIAMVFQGNISLSSDLTCNICTKNNVALLIGVWPTGFTPYNGITAHIQLLQKIVSTAKHTICTQPNYLEVRPLNHNISLRVNL